jgi:hypothetical protein
MENMVGMRWWCERKEKDKGKQNEELKEAGGKSSWKERRKKIGIAERRMRRGRKIVHKEEKRRGLG